MSESDQDSLVLELEQALEPTRERETELTHDGWLIDSETGEVLEYQPLPAKFTVNSDDAGDWVLKLLSEIEGEIAGLQARKVALVEQIDRMIGQRRSRLAWWSWKFESELIAYARQALKGLKGKTKAFAWGKVSFTRTQGTNEIVAMDAAVEYVRVMAPELVVMVTKETVTIAAIKIARARWEKASGESGALPFLVSSGPGENVTISTGIDVDASLKKKGRKS